MIFYLSLLGAEFTGLWYHSSGNTYLSINYLVDSFRIWYLEGGESRKEEEGPRLCQWWKDCMLWKKSDPACKEVYTPFLHFSLAMCHSCISYCCDEILWQKQLERKVYLAHNSRSIVAGKSALEAWDCCSHSEIEQEWCMLMLGSYVAQDPQPMEWCHPHWVGLPD